MEDNMIALVTGATAGFGTAICRKLVSQGYRVIGAGRRLEKLQALQAELGADKFHCLAFDLNDRQATEAAVANLPAEWAQVDLLINNAGLALGVEPAYKANLDDWHTMVQTNILGTINLTNLLLPGMVKRHSGYVINLGSIAGTWPYYGGNIYGATKAFIRQFSLNLRADLVGTGVRVTNLEPGLCGGTEFSNVRFRGDDARAASVYENIDYVTPEDIADIVGYLASTPAHVNINTLEVMPTAQTYGGLRVDKRDFKVELE